MTCVPPEVDFFVPSMEELCFMLDRPRYESWIERAGDGDVTETLDLRMISVRWHPRQMDLGVKVLMLKCGAQGMYYQTGGLI